MKQIKLTELYYWDNNDEHIIRLNIERNNYEIIDATTFGSGYNITNSETNDYKENINYEDLYQKLNRNGICFNPQLLNLENIIIDNNTNSCLNKDDIVSNIKHKNKNNMFLSFNETLKFNNETFNLLRGKMNLLCFEKMMKTY